MVSREIRGVPQDTITSISYNRDILSSSWDRSLSLYSVAASEIKRQVRTKEPVLKTILSSRVLTGDISGNVGIYSNSLDEISEIATDVGGIQLLHEHRGRIVAGGWNKKISFIGDRVEDTINTERKIYCSDLSGDILLVGQQEYVIAYDLRTNAPFFRRKFSMPIRSLALGDNGFFAGTTGGKIYHENFTDNTKSYVFNAHYSISGNTKTFYPVNALIMDENLFSGGSDGKILRWRLSLKKTCKEIMGGKVGVSGLCLFDKKLAIAFSYSYDRGEYGSHSSKIAVLDL